MPAVQDRLRCLAVKQGPLLVGTRYWAKQALTSVLSHLQAANMRLLLQQPNSNSDKPEVGALMVVCPIRHLLALTTSLEYVQTKVLPLSWL